MFVIGYLYKQWSIELDVDWRCVVVWTQWCVSSLTWARARRPLRSMSSVAVAIALLYRPQGRRGEILCAVPASGGSVDPTPAQVDALTAIDTLAIDTPAGGELRRSDGRRVALAYRAPGRAHRDRQGRGAVAGWRGGRSRSGTRQTVRGVARVRIESIEGDVCHVVVLAASGGRVGERLTFSRAALYATQGDEWRAFEELVAFLWGRR